ncbi:MAG: 4-oxalocrotonate tautomerase family protein [Desulfarculus sp.]|nr:4-oxalocrotonate tautomerase family protein [Desulfarculus sp.]
MPLVNIKLIPDGITAQQKAKVIAGVTKVMEKVLKKNPAQTIVIIEEVPAENWGAGGEQVTAIRQKAAK